MATFLESKALFGILGLGAVGGTAVVGYTVFKKDEKTLSPKTKKTIAKLIEESGKKILLTRTEKANGAEWKASWKLYREDNKTLKKDADPWTLGDFTGNYESTSPIPEETAPESFISKCVSLSTEEVEDVEDNRYIQVSKWCTKDKEKSPQG